VVSLSDKRGPRPSTFRDAGNRFSRVKRRKDLRGSVRSWKYERLVDAVRVLLNRSGHGVTEEMLAWELRAKRVKKALYQMVREGYLHAPANRHPWDFKWGASVWPRRRTAP
jgi:hypothetical protein